jgi:hypothetical protein
VIIGILVFYIFLFVLAVATLGLQEASGEVLPLLQCSGPAQAADIETRLQGD